MIQLPREFPKELHKQCRCFECGCYDSALFSLSQAIYNSNACMEDFKSFKEREHERPKRSWWETLIGVKDDKEQRRSESDYRMKDIKESSGQVSRIMKRMHQKLKNEPIDDWNYCKCWLCISEFITQEQVKKYKTCYSGCDECLWDGYGRNKDDR